MKTLKKSFKKFSILSLSIFLSITTSLPVEAEVPIYENDDFFPIKQLKVIINTLNQNGDIVVQFGDLLAKTLSFDIDTSDIGGNANGSFVVNDGLTINENNTETAEGLGLSIVNSGSGDAIAQYIINGVQRWVTGIDNSDSDKFKIASSQDLNSDARLTITTNGEVGINDSNTDATMSIRPVAPIAGNDFIFKTFQTPTQPAGNPTFGIVGDGSFGMDLNGNPVWFGVYNGALIFAGNYNANTEVDGIDLVGNTNWGSVSPSGYGMSNSTASIDAGTGNIQSDGNISIDGTGTNYLTGNTAIGKTSASSALDVLGELRLSGSNSGFVGFTPQADAGGATYTLPASDGSPGFALTTDGSGNLSWQAGGASSGDITAVGSITSGNAFSDASSDDNWLGLGASAGRIEFDDQATDEINFINSNIGINTSTPQSELDISTTDGSIRIGNSFPNKSVSTDTGISMYNANGDFKSGIFTEVDGGLLSYGINISQLGDRDETKMGAIFRMDTRTTSPYFSIKKQSIGGSAESSDMQIAQSGDIGFGAWPNDTNSFPANVSILTRASNIISQVIRGANGQTADLQQWQANTGTILSSIESTGLLNVFKTGEAVNMGDGSANDIYLNFDDGTSRNFGWDDSFSTNHPDGSFSTFNNELAFRTLQSGSSPLACTSTIAGMQWFDTDTGLLYICDTGNGRNKWLTTTEQLIFGEQSGTCNSGTDIGNSTNCAIEYGGSLGSDGENNGLFIARDITITGYGFSEDNDACTSGSFDIEVWGNGSNTTDQGYSLEQTIASNLNDEAHNNTNLNIDISGNQYINIGIDNNCGQGMDDFNIILYYRYRHS